MSMCRLAVSLSMLIWTPFGVVAAECPDPAGDLLGSATPPYLDIVSLETQFEPGTFVIRLILDAGVTVAEIEGISGFIDFDTDSTASTGRATHCEEFGLSPCPPVGVDYFLELVPFSGGALLYHSDDGMDQEIGDFPIIIDGSSISVALPRCETTPEDGICIAAQYHVAALIGNAFGPTDVLPDDEMPCVAAPGTGDYDHDGDVDQDDLGFFRNCFSGASIPIDSSECRIVDLDEDGDADQSDFGLLQAVLTGPM